MNQEVKLTPEEQNEFDTLLSDLQIEPNSEFDDLVNDYIDKCGYSPHEARVAANNALREE